MPRIDYTSSYGKSLTGRNPRCLFGLTCKTAQSSAYIVVMFRPPPHSSLALVVKCPPWGPFLSRILSKIGFLFLFPIIWFLDYRKLHKGLFQNYRFFVKILNFLIFGRTPPYSGHIWVVQTFFSDENVKKISIILSLEDPSDGPQFVFFFLPNHFCIPNIRPNLCFFNSWENDAFAKSTWISWICLRMFL